ncbi:MAG: hypothetical protein H7835_19585 [Magnetococcus sp. XQGC-1]
MIISDSVLSRVIVGKAKLVQRFIRLRSKNPKKNLPAEFSCHKLDDFVKCEVENDAEDDIFQFAFGGWKASDGITPQIKDILIDATSDTVVTSVFLSIGINDIR